MIEKKIWLPRACLAILVLAQITVCICFGIAKGGYDIDEMLTYGLANGHNKPPFSPPLQNKRIRFFSTASKSLNGLQNRRARRSPAILSALILLRRKISSSISVRPIGTKSTILTRRFIIFFSMLSVL